jgi:tetratricopeptide (TPR) repeat protein
MFTPHVKSALLYLLTGYIVVVLLATGQHVLWVLAFALPVIIVNRYARARLVDFYIGAALTRHGRYEDALRRLNRFIDKLDADPARERMYPLTSFDSHIPVRKIARFHKAVCYFETGCAERAREMFEALVKEQPDFLECYLNLAGIAIKAGDEDMAVQWLKQGAFWRNDKFIGVVSTVPFLDAVRKRPEVQELLTPNEVLCRRQKVGSLVFWLLAVPLALWVVALFLGVF